MNVYYPRLPLIKSRPAVDWLARPSDSFLMKGLRHEVRSLKGTRRSPDLFRDVLQQYSSRNYSQDFLQAAVQRFEESSSKIDFLLDLLEQEAGAAERKERRIPGEVRTLADLRRVLARYPRLTQTLRTRGAGPAAGLRERRPAAPRRAR